MLAGTTIFTADNTYAGNTTIASGAALSLGNGGTTGNVVGPIFNSGVLAFDHSNTFIVPGVIAGTGAVQQNGTGTTILTADNLYTGGTTINDGSLQLGNGGLSGSIVGDVTNNATLIFNRSNTYNFDGTISGAGSVGQIGTGTTTFNTPQDYTGTTNINAGVLEVNSTLASPAVNVNAGGTLAGIGDLVGHVVNAGTVAPGTSLVGFGTLTVGSYAGLGGTLTIDTQLGDDNSPTDQLIIDGGTATGTTGVIVTNQGGLGAQTTNGIPIILPTGGATIAAGTFGASGSVVPGAAAGVYQYLLYQGTEAGGGSAEAEQTYYLRSHEGDTPLYRPDARSIPSSPTWPAGRSWRPSAPSMSAMATSVGRWRRQPHGRLGPPVRRDDRAKPFRHRERALRRQHGRPAGRRGRHAVDERLRPSGSFRHLCRLRAHDR